MVLRDSLRLLSYFLRDVTHDMVKSLTDLLNYPLLVATSLMDDSLRINALFGDLFKIPRPMVEASSALIIGANLLHLNEVQMLPIVHGFDGKIDPGSGIKMYPTLGGYTLLKAIMRADPRDYMELIWKPCREIASWIGSVKYDSTLDDLLHVFDLTKFGDAVVELSGNAKSLITLQDVMVFYRKDIMRSTIPVSEIGTDIISVPQSSRLSDVLRIIFDNGIRRVRQKLFSMAKPSIKRQKKWEIMSMIV